MKKSVIIAVGLLMGLVAQAQDGFPLQFVGNDGEIIPDGTVLNLTDIEEDFFGDLQMPSGISVMNVGDEMVYGGATYTIIAITNGRFQTCFPLYCMTQEEVGTYETGAGAILPDQLMDMQTEFFPDGDGTCFVTYQLQTYRKVGKNYFPDEDGPTITLRFATDPDGIGSIKGDKVQSVTYYGLSGQKVEHPRRGIFMKKTTFADGSFTVRKCVLR